MADLPSFTQLYGTKQIIKDAEIKRKNLQGLNVKNKKFYNCTFKKSNLQNADFSSTLHSKNSFFKNVMPSSNFSNSVLIKTVISDSDLRSSNFTDTILYKSSLKNNKFNNSVLSRAQLKGVEDLKTCDFSGSSMDNIKFEKCDLTDVNLSNKDLKGSEFRNCRLWATNFSGSDLSNANLSKATGIGKSNFEGTILQGAVLKEVKLFNKNLSQRNLRNTNFNRSLLKKVNFSGSDLQNASLRSADLSTANLSGADLSNANLSGANLTGADMRGANLTHTNLIQANLTNANLEGANIDDAIREPPVQQTPQGVAFEIHKYFKKIPVNTLINFLTTHTKNKKGVSTIANSQITNDLSQTFSSVIEKMDKDERTSRSAGLKRIINERLRTFDYKKMVPKTTLSFNKLVQIILCYFKEQPIEFQKNYVGFFVDDCTQAYKTGNGMSCTAGIMERLIVSLKNATLGLESNETNDYQLLVSLVDFNMNEMLLNLRPLWFKSPEIKSLTPEQRKSHYIKFMKSKFDIDNIVEGKNDIIDLITKDAQTLFDSEMFSDASLEYMGGRRINRRYRNRMYKTLKRVQ
jgi:uncharacterized protein YjbI with pentapeptide repeats